MHNGLARRLKNAKKFAFFLTPLALATLRQSDFLNALSLFTLNAVDATKRASGNASIY